MLGDKETSVTPKMQESKTYSRSFAITSITEEDQIQKLICVPSPTRLESRNWWNNRQRMPHGVTTRDSLISLEAKLLSSRQRKIDPNFSMRDLQYAAIGDTVKLYPSTVKLYRKARNLK